MLKVNERIQIPLKEFQFTFARGSGPGGQNVNKLNTKVTLRWSIYQSTHLPESVRQRIAKTYHRRINKDGELLIFSHRFRDQGRNVADCLNKLREMIAEAAKTKKRRIATKPSKNSKLRRLDEKKANSARKNLRRTPSADSD